jgi:hypothetical protein
LIGNWNLTVIAHQSWPSVEQATYLASLTIPANCLSTDLIYYFIVEIEPILPEL